MGLVKFFDNCQEDKQEILGSFFERDYEREKVPPKFWAVSQSSHFYIIEKGVAYVYMQDPKISHRPVLLNTLSSGDFLGEIGLFHHVKTGGSIFTGELELWKIIGNDETERLNNLKKLFGKFPQLAMNVFAEESWRLIRQQRFTPSHDVRSQLRFLFVIEQTEKHGDEVRLSLREIEQSLGVARNSVKTHLRALVRSGILAVTKDAHGYSYKILDDDKLTKDLWFRI